MPSQPIVFYHSTTPDAALKIIAEGFRDSRGRLMGDILLKGIFVSNYPVSFNEGAKGDALLRLTSERPWTGIGRYELIEEGKPYREWCVPARLLNKYFAVRVLSWGSVSLMTRDMWEGVGAISASEVASRFSRARRKFIRLAALARKRKAAK